MRTHLPPPVVVSQPFLRVIRGFLALHRLTVAGDEDGPAGDAIRTGLEQPWRALNPREKGLVERLSEDLFSITDPPAELRPMNPQAQKGFAGVVEAVERREWERALGQAYRWREYIEPGLLAHIRGAAWRDAGVYEAAVEFFRHSAALDPTDLRRRVAVLFSLRYADLAAARAEGEALLARGEPLPLAVAVMAATAVIDSTTDMPDDRAGVVYNSLIGPLKRSLGATPTGDVDGHAVMTAHVLLAQCYSHAGDATSALNVLNEGLLADPDHEPSLVSRGILLYGTGGQAVRDFERAVRQGSATVWPHLFLAHAYLTTDRFSDCLRMCEAGLRCHAVEPRVRSQLWEWSAISRNELGFPGHMVREAFQEAVSADRTNQLAQENWRRYEDAQASRTKVVNWDKATDAQVRGVGYSYRPPEFRIANAA